MRITKTYLLLAVIALTATSCLVSKKKYDELLAQKLRLEADKGACDDSLAASKAKLAQAFTNIEGLTSQNGGLKKDTARLINNLKNIKSLLDEEKKTTGKLRRDYNDLLAICDAESNKLNKHLSQKEKELLDTQANIAKLSEDLKTREMRVQELQRILDEKEKATKALKDKVADALLGFKDKGLTVYEKDGRVYVSMSEQLLFKSGSTKVDEKGVDAIKQLTKVLNDQKDINVMVEGHTDDVPFKGSAGGIADNWDLSVLRATSITKIMTGDGLDAKRIISSGRGQYFPLDEAKTAEARAKNRRTEIILEPKLDELMKLLNDK